MQAREQPDFPGQLYDDEITLAEILAFLRRYWLWLFAGGFVGGAAALGVSFLMTPVYRAEIVIAPVDDDQASTLARVAGQLGPLGGVLGFDLGGTGAQRELWIGTLRSRDILRRFLKAHVPLETLFPERIDPETGQWMLDDDGQPAIPTENEAVDRLQRDVFTISEDRRSGLLTVAVEWRDGALAAAWANALVELTNSSLRQRAIEEAERNIAYLEGELAKTNVVERQQIIYRLIESRTREIMLAKGRPEYAFIVVDRAVPPDSDQYVRPRRFLMAAVGVVVGAVVGALAALAFGQIRVQRLENLSTAHR